MASINLTTTTLLINGNEGEPAFTLPHNNSFRICNDETSEEHVPSREREGTPFIRLQKMWLVLTISRKPFDPLFGWVFGSDDDLCDLVLDIDSTQGVSGRHFRIDHDWESKSLILTNMSRHGTKLSSPSIGLRGKVISGSGTWRIRPDEQTTIEAGKSSITVEIPRRGRYQTEYDDNLEANYQEVQKAVPQVGRLRFHSSLVETPMVARGERTRSQYILQEEIGRGAFATVFKAFDPSTKRVYAAKKLTYEHSSAELNILSKVSHDHIVSFVDVLDSPDTILVMEYMACGNLSQLKSPTKDEITTTIYQQLIAVRYLHQMGITHRDIKPENILVQQRRPELITKLSDFGLSSDTARLETFCGTDLYCAPEIEESYRKNIPGGTRARYTRSVDVYSLGIVYMQYSIGLPQKPKPWSYSRWTRHIQLQVSNHREETGSLLPEMLQLDPGKRPSAEECLSKASLPSSSLSTASNASKRGRHLLSTIREDSPRMVTSSAERRKRACLVLSESSVQLEDRRKSICTDPQLSGDLSESDKKVRLTGERVALHRGVEGEREPQIRPSEENWNSVGGIINPAGRQELVRRLLTQEIDEAGQGPRHNLISDPSLFYSSDLR